MGDFGPEDYISPFGTYIHGYPLSEDHSRPPCKVNMRARRDGPYQITVGGLETYFHESKIIAIDSDGNVSIVDQLPEFISGNRMGVWQSWWESPPSRRR